jgi:hypothetical protein
MEVNIPAKIYCFMAIRFWRADIQNCLIINFCLGTSCLRKPGITSALIKTLSTFYAGFVQFHWKLFLPFARYEAYGFHWNNAQATIHPFVIYFKKSDALNMEHDNLVLVSYLSKHDSILVHTFQWHIMKFTKTHLTRYWKMLFTSLMGLQPNIKTEKNVLNITCHNVNTRVPAEWHFFATSHGKGLW